MRVFIAASFSTKVDESGDVLREHRDQLELLIDGLEAEGHTVFCALKDEGWRITQNDPATELLRDMRHIDSADVVVALLGSSLSAGVQIEIGYALAKERHIVLAKQKSDAIAWSNAAVGTMPNCRVIAYQDMTELVRLLISSI